MSSFIPPSMQCTPLLHCRRSLLVLKSTSYSLLAKALGDNSASRQSLHFTMHTWLCQYLLVLFQCGDRGMPEKFLMKYEPQYSTSPILF